MNKQEFSDHLIFNIIPFWNRMRDDEFGGFYGYADAKGVPDKKYFKGVILGSRILWFYSAAYRLLGDPALLEMAAHQYEFMSKYCLDPVYGGVFWSVSYDGNPEDTVKHTYNQAFAVYALSEYYMASGKTEALSHAIRLYQLIENKCRDKEGYLESFNRDFSPGINEYLSENGVTADRTMNTLLHVWEAYTGLYRALLDMEDDKCSIQRIPEREFNSAEKPDHNKEELSRIREELTDKLTGILEIFTGKIYSPEERSCEVFFDMQYNSLIDLRSYGHDIEASWLIDRGIQLLTEGCHMKEDTAVSRDPEQVNEQMKLLLMQALDTTDELAQGVWQNGMDALRQSVYAEREKGHMDRKKIWWVQAEAVTGFYNAYQKHPFKTAYKQAAEDIWTFIRNYMVDPLSGEWFENLSPENKVYPDQAMVQEWKCPYHNGRMCIEMIRRLDH